MNAVSCRYLTLAPGACRDDPPGENPLVCTWALKHRKRLAGMPPWLERAALAGELLRPGDCAACQVRVPQ